MTRWPRSAISTSHSYEWVVEGDIKACFDEISHPALMDRVRRRVGDKRVLALVKAFLKAGILGEDRVLRDDRHRHPAGVDSHAPNALGNFEFDVTLSYRRLERPRRVTNET